MRYKTVEDILEQAAALHQRVAEMTAQAADHQKRERLAMVLDYLADHQNRLQLAVRAFRREAASTALETWFDRAPELDLPDFDEASLDQIDRLEPLLERVAEFHERMVVLYANLRDQARIEPVREIFADLAEIERHEKTELIQGARQLQDI